MNKNGEIGLAMLIIFITLLMFAGIIATVIMQSSSKIQGDTLLTTDEGQKQLSTSLKVTDITISKDEHGDYRDVQAILKPVEGSDTIRLDQMVIVTNMNDDIVAMSYRGTNATFDHTGTGYRTFGTQEIGEMGVYTSPASSPIGLTWSNIPKVDYDLDGVTDTNKICCVGPNGCPDGSKNSQAGWMAINVSSHGIIYVRVVDATDSPIDICSGSGIAADDMTPVGSYGYINISGNVGSASIPASAVNYYLTPTNLTENLDDDGNFSDYLYINSTDATFVWTNGDIDVVSLGKDISTPQELNIQNAEIGSPAKGTLTIQGNTTRNNYIDENVTFRISPVSTTGYYVNQYLEQSDNTMDGFIQPGDIVRIYLQLPESLYENEQFSLKFIPNNGVPTYIQVMTPDVLGTSKVKLFP